jgi:hypothetical protein
MLELLLALIGELVGELFVYALLDLILEFVWRFFGQPFRPRHEANPVVSAIAALTIGAVVGGISGLFWSQRLLPVVAFPGASLMLAPLAGAVTMELFGRASEARGWPASFLATWWAGGLLPFGFALARFLIVGGT